MTMKWLQEPGGYGLWVDTLCVGFICQTQDGWYWQSKDDWMITKTLEACKLQLIFAAVMEGSV